MRPGPIIATLGIIALTIAACGGEEAAPPPTRAAAAAPSIVATPAGADDVIVARVDGRPVYGSCVAAQATGGTGRAAALAQCIDFELLAGAAAARGLAASSAVIDAQREAMVSRFIDAEFTAKIRSVADLPREMVETTVERQAPFLSQPLRRSGVYVRATLPRGTPAGAPEEVKARALIEEIHAALAARRDLFADDLFETGERIAAARGAKVDYERRPYPTAIDQDADPVWRKALFAVPTIGMITPPVRSSFGWEVILWVDVTPATNQGPGDLQAALFPDLRRAFFKPWTNRFAKAMRIEVHAEQLQALEEER